MYHCSLVASVNGCHLVCDTDYLSGTHVRFGRLLPRGDMLEVNTTSWLEECAWRSTGETAKANEETKDFAMKSSTELLCNHWGQRRQTTRVKNTSW